MLMNLPLIFYRYKLSDLHPVSITFTFQFARTLLIPLKAVHS
jgi:hypothetical protein